MVRRFANKQEEHVHFSHLAAVHKLKDVDDNDRRGPWMGMQLTDTGLVGV